MCGRYATTLDPETLYGIFDAEPDPGTPAPGGTVPLESGPYGGDAPRPRYNIGPTTDNPVVRIRRTDDGEVRRIDWMHWGLVPSWAKDPSVGNRMFNARAESVPTKGAFRTALGKRRALVPASGFFEWQKLDRATPRSTGSAKGRAAAKQPFYIAPADGSVMAFAGLWEYWKPKADGDGEEPPGLLSYTILTVEAVGEMAEIHDRMPLILPAEHWDAWLDPARSADDVAALLAPPSQALVRALEFRPVGPAVGNVNNDSPDILRRVQQTPAGAEPDGQLALPLGS